MFIHCLCMAWFLVLNTWVFKVKVPSLEQEYPVVGGKDHGTVLPCQRGCQKREEGRHLPNNGAHKLPGKGQGEHGAMWWLARGGGNRGKSFFWGFLRKQCWYRRRADRQSRSRKGLKEYFPSRGRLIFYEGALFPCKLSHLGTLGSSDTWHRNWHIGGGDTLESFTFHDLSTKPYVIDRIHFVFRHFWKDIVLTTKGLPGDECWVKSWGHLNYCWTRPSENYISSLVVNLF